MYRIDGGTEKSYIVNYLFPLLNNISLSLAGEEGMKEEEIDDTKDYFPPKLKNSKIFF